MQLLVIIVSWNTRNLLDSCLLRLRAELANSGLDTKSVVVDNASRDDSALMVKSKHPWVTLIANYSNVGFGRANNQALLSHPSDFVLFLNPDTEILPGAFSKLWKFILAHPKAAVVAPQLLNTDGSVQNSCRSFPTLHQMFFELIGVSKLFRNVKSFRSYKLLDFDHRSIREVDQPEGACLLVRRSVLEEVGIFDERFFMLFEEVDLCYRIKQAGWQIWFYPEAQVIHHYGQSIKQVKAKMIYHSHMSFFRYITKHSRTRFFTFLDPFLFFSLILLAIFRILYYYLKKAFSFHAQ